VKSGGRRLLAVSLFVLLRTRLRPPPTATAPCVDAYPCAGLIKEPEIKMESK
jgi:hypothetical protein